MVPEAMKGETREREIHTTNCMEDEKDSSWIFYTHNSERV
jgi:hypothetical protein